MLKIKIKIKKWDGRAFDDDERFKGRKEEEKEGENGRGSCLFLDQGDQVSLYLLVNILCPRGCKRVEKEGVLEEVQAVDHEDRGLHVVHGRRGQGTHLHGWRQHRGENRCKGGLLFRCWHKGRVKGGHDIFLWIGRKSKKFWSFEEEKERREKKVQTKSEVASCN